MTARLSHLGEQPNSKSAQFMHPREPLFLFVGHVVSFCEGQYRYSTYKQNCIARCLAYRWSPCCMSYLYILAL